MNVFERFSCCHFIHSNDFASMEKTTHSVRASSIVWNIGWFFFQLVFLLPRFVSFNQNTHAHIFVQNFRVVFRLPLSSG